MDQADSRSCSTARPGSPAASRGDPPRSGWPGFRRAVEIGPAHTDLDGLLNNPSAQARLKDACAQRGLTISAFSAHGNPLRGTRKLGQNKRDEERTGAADGLAPYHPKLAALMRPDMKDQP